MDLKISKRASLTPASPIRKLVPLADQAKKKGIKVYHLNIGQPDFKLPDPIKKELTKLSETDYLPYANSLGIKETVLAWQKYYQDINIPLEEQDIIVTSGGSEALILAFAAISDPSDEIIVFEPYYANYSGFANLLSAKIVPILLNPDNYHLPVWEAIEKAISPKTKAILVTNPNNPTGTVFDKEELELIVDLAKKHNLFIIADETYRGLIFDNKKSWSFLEFLKGENRQKLIVIDSLSKRLNICGARIGAIISKNKAIMAAVNSFCQARLSVATLDQQIVVPMLRNSLPYITKLAKEYQKRRDALIEVLESGLRTNIHRPEGAFYLMVKLPVQDSDHFASWLLSDFNKNKETVMVAPGSGFYATPGRGKNEVRIAYVLKESDLKKAAKLLVEAVANFNASFF